MKNSTLFFRSFIIIALLAGFAHLFANTVRKNPSVSVGEKIESDIESLGVDSLASSSQKATNTNIERQETESSDNYNSNTDYIIGKWKVSYNSDEFKGAIIYNIKKEGNTFNAYAYQYEDEKGDAQRAEGTKTVTINKFDGYLGEGIYLTEYEGEKYELSCLIEMKDENTFELSYDYYGYSDVETWKRL